MMNKNEKIIYVFSDWYGQKEPVFVGVLHAVSVRGKLAFSFEYDSAWLKNESAFTLDPSLQLYQGRQYAHGEQENFSIFLDSSPDRWGRLLMNRREAQKARAENRQAKSLLETDYLLGVYDEYRIGALRFKTDKNGDFLDSDKTLAAPPWASLKELEQASLAFERPGSEKDPHYSSWLKMLIAPGGSLGGARPKACVLDQKHHPWIAKFPSNHDEYDVGAWEMLINNLASLAGVTVAEARLKRFNSKYHTFLSKRFDRTETKERIHFASAMTLLQHVDGDDALSGASYLELAEFIMQQGADPAKDLEQLWRRIVFNMCVSNVDDHLRNHAFILHPEMGWVLSPAFDMNPIRNGDGLKLNVSENDNAQDLLLAKEVAQYFRLKQAQATKILGEVVTAVRRWPVEAKRLRISSPEQDWMSSAFRLVL